MAGLAALALVGTGLAGTAQAAYPGQDGLIAFVRGGNIYTIESERVRADPADQRRARLGAALVAGRAADRLSRPGQPVDHVGQRP